LISKLRLQSFRAYEEAELEFDPGFNRIVGQNGVGKTSLLEAIAHLGLGGSPWSERSGDVIANGQPFSIISGKGPSRRQDVSIKLVRGGRKEVQLCGKPVPKMTELLGVFPMTTIGPQEINLVKGSPTVRRRMLDSVLCQISPEYTNALGRYRKLVAERNSALKGVRSGKMAGGLILIDTIDEAIAPEAAFVMESRERYIIDLSKLTQQIYLEIMGGEGAVVSVKYIPTIKVESLSVGDLSAAFYEKLSARRRLDLESCETAIGPHRDDAQFYKNSDELSRFGSWGQARAASIAAILAASELLHRNIRDEVTLLLDDCFSELDPENTDRFIQAASRYGQVIIASPREIESPKGGALFTFEDVGKIRRANAT